MRSHRPGLPMFRGLSLAFALFLPIVSSTQAQNALGGRAGSPFRMGFGARSVGMGQSLSAVPSNEGAAGGNPSLLPYVHRPSVELGVYSLALDRSLVFASYVTNLPPSAGLSFTFTGARASDLPGRDRNGLPTETYTTGEYAFGLHFGLKPSAKITLGAGARLLYAKLLPELSQSTVGLDFGASYLVFDELMVSAVFRDVNSKYRWDTSKLYGRDGNTTVDEFPTRTILAASYNLEELGALVDVELESAAGVTMFRAGTELQIHQMVTLRSGLDAMDPSGQVGSRFSFGFSLSETGITLNPSLDYAFVLEPYAPAGAHVLSVRFRIKE